MAWWGPEGSSQAHCLRGSQRAGRRRGPTIFAWDSWEKSYPDEPPLWFHDIFRPDGTPYNAKETELILKLTRTLPPSR